MILPDHFHIIMSSIVSYFSGIVTDFLQYELYYSYDYELGLYKLILKACGKEVKL